MTGHRVRIGYADPPYLGCCKLYEHHHPEGDRPFDGRCWDEIETYEALIGWLYGEFPDGWAMSATSGSLQHLLPLCPSHRVGAWVKPFHAYKKGVRPAYAWEPLIYVGGRQMAVAPEKGGKATTPKDFVSANIVLRKGFTGAKPEPFCLWMFDLMGLTREDELVDIFAGSGLVTDAWEKWCSMNVLDFTAGSHRQFDAASSGYGAR